MSFTQLITSHSMTKLVQYKYVFSRTSFHSSKYLQLAPSVLSEQILCYSVILSLALFHFHFLLKSYENVLRWSCISKHSTLSRYREVLNLNLVSWYNRIWSFEFLSFQGFSRWKRISNYFQEIRKKFQGNRLEFFCFSPLVLSPETYWNRSNCTSHNK